MKSSMPGSVPNVRKAKAIQEKKQAACEAGVAKLKKRAAASKRAR